MFCVQINFVIHIFIEIVMFLNVLLRGISTVLTMICTSYKRSILFATKLKHIILLIIKLYQLYYIVDISIENDYYVCQRN